jgi:hypothetical protein
MKKIKKFRDYDEYDGVYEDRRDRIHKLEEKRMRAALRARNFDRFMDYEDD